MKIFNALFVLGIISIIFCLPCSADVDTINNLAISPPSIFPQEKVVLEEIAEGRDPRDHVSITGYLGLPVGLSALPQKRSVGNTCTPMGVQIKYGGR